MTSYTVTITPDDPALAVATIRLDITGAAATIKELRLVPGSDGGLTPGRLPILDMNQLVAAVIAAVIPGTTKSAVGSVAAEDARQGRAAPQKATGRRRSRPSEDDGQTATPRKRAAAKTQAKKTTRPAKKTTAAPAEPAARTYRRVPQDFDQVLRQAGESGSVIADHYGVPRHTAYSWIRAARRRAATAA
jgi:hypothetical protein